MPRLPNQCMCQVKLSQAGQAACSCKKSTPQQPRTPAEGAHLRACQVELSQARQAAQRCGICITHGSAPAQIQHLQLLHALQLGQAAADQEGGRRGLAQRVSWRLSGAAAEAGHRNASQLTPRSALPSCYVASLDIAPT